MIVHVRFIGSPMRLNSCFDRPEIRPGHGPAKTKSLQPGRQPAVFTPPPAYPEIAALIYADRRVRLILPSPETHSARLADRRLSGECRPLSGWRVIQDQ